MALFRPGSLDGGGQLTVKSGLEFYKEQYLIGELRGHSRNTAVAELELNIIYVLAASAGLGWLVAFIGMWVFIGKFREPWMGLAAQILMTQRQKDKRVAEVYEHMRDPENRLAVIMIFGGMAWFALHVIGIMVAAPTLVPAPTSKPGRCILVQQEYAKPSVCSSSSQVSRAG